MLFKWNPNLVPRKVYIFGCGGTGSRVVPLIAQFIKSCPWIVNPEIRLIDFDEVEEKNLLRQNFIATDVGKNKAVVLANRYSKAFNISIIPYTTKFTIDPVTEAESSTYTDIRKSLSGEEMSNNVFILCVDTPEARREIVASVLGLVGHTADNIIIDAGNENDFGQVTFSASAGVRQGSTPFDLLEDKCPTVVDLPYVPLDPTYYDQMDANNTPSCADLDQTMAINTLMAVNIFSIFQNIAYVKPMNFYRMNISLQHGANPQYIDINYLKQCSSKPPKIGKVHGRCQFSSFDRIIDTAISEQKEFYRKLEQELKIANLKKLEEEEKKVESVEEQQEKVTIVKAKKLVELVFDGAISII